MMDVDSRVIHPIFGPGTIAETLFTAGSHLPAAKVSFDDGSERVLLLSVLTVSKTPAHPAKKPRRKTVKYAPMQEEVPDDKLLIEVPDYTERTAIRLDEPNIEEAVTQDVE